MRRHLLAGNDELKLLRERIARKPFNFIYERLRKRCAMTLQSSPVTESQWRMLSQQGVANAALNAARTAQGRIMDLLVAHAIDPNPAYRDRAIEELRNLISWSTWVEPQHNHEGVDLCTAEAAVAAVIGLDWLYDDLPEVDRLRVVHALRNRVITPYRRAVAEKAWWYTSSNSWNAVVNSGCGMAALMLGDDEPTSQEAYQMARSGLKCFFNALGREGGWDEGIAHWGYAMRYILLLGESVSRTLGDRSIFHTRGMGVTSLFGVYFTPNGQYAGFGDQQAVPLYGTLYLLVKHFGQKELTWWLDNLAFHRDVSATDWSAAGLALIFRPVDAETTDTPDLERVRVFHEIGWAAMVDQWPRPTFYVSAKAGDLAAGHSLRDMCSLQLQVGGEMLLTDLGLPPITAQQGDEISQEMAEIQAASHNTLIIGRRDQVLDAQGAIVEAQDEPQWRWLACNAGNAWGDDVQHVRHIIMLTAQRSQEGTMLVVLDELTNVTPENVDLFWHTPGQITASGPMTGAIQGTQNALHYAIHSSGPASLSVLHKEHNRKKDDILHLDLGSTSKAVVVSAFSRHAAIAAPTVKKAATGEVTIKIGKASLHFKPSKRHMLLDKVTGLSK